KRKLWWKCTKATCSHHQWKASIQNRTGHIGKISGCPYCNGAKTCRCNSFGKKHPQLLEEFLEAGGDKHIAFSTSHGSGKKLKWKCLKAKCSHHVYEASVSSRIRNDSGCPFCADIGGAK